MENHTRIEILKISKNCLQNNKYQFIEDEEGQCHPIGNGGSGIVYVANQLFNSEGDVFIPRAIKFFTYREDLVKDNKYVSNYNFLTEIKNITQFTHQNILKVIDGDYYDVVVDGETIRIPYTVTEFINGPTLENIFEEEKTNECRDFLQSEEKVFDIFLQIAKGIKYLHENNFFHCDIAPKNIFLRKNIEGEWFAVVGDIGAGITLDNIDEKVFITGTWNYMTQEARNHKGNYITMDDFKSLQPQWDVFSFKKTLLEIIFKIKDSGLLKDVWHLDRLRDRLEKNEFYSILQIEEVLELLHPNSNKIFKLDELSEASNQIRQVLSPIYPVYFSKRMYKLSKHNMLLRLMDVPQLLEGAATFPGANHTRYEHTLGTYELMRKVMIALLRNKEYESFFDERTIVIGLLSALFSSLIHFPLSYAAVELKSQQKNLLEGFDETRIFDSLMNYSEDDEASLIEKIHILFEKYHISIEDLEYVLFGKPSNSRQDDKLEVLYRLLNSSVGIRVIDYMTRDSYHIGLKYNVDTDALFSFMSIKDKQFCLNQMGISSAEQVIINRYWMFKRIYWCEPNRANVALLKYLFYISATKEFVDEMISQIPTMTRERMQNLMKKHNPNKTAMIDSIFAFVNQKGKNRYKRLTVIGKGNAKKNAGRIWEFVVTKNYEEQFELSKKLENRIIHELHIDFEDIKGAPVVLFDLPFEKKGNKLGNDVNVISYDGNEIMLTKASEIIGKMHDTFDDQLMLLRIYLRPDIYQKYISNDAYINEKIEDVIYDELTINM